MADLTRGLFRKFNVSRTDGRDAPGGDKAGAEYLVLDYANDPNGWICAAVYASLVVDLNPRMASDLAARLFVKLALFPEPKRKQIDDLLSSGGVASSLLDSEVYKLLKVMAAAGSVDGVTDGNSSGSVGSQ